MFSKFLSPLGLAALAATVCHAGPVAPFSPAVGLADLAVRASDVSLNAKRTQDKASFDMAHTWNKDQVLYDGSHNGKGNLNVACKNCYTKGSIDASIVNMNAMRLDFSGMEAYVDLAVSTSHATTYTLTLFELSAPISIGIPGLAGAACDCIFAVDLVFSLDKAIDISSGGFYVSLPADTYVESSLAKGEVTGSLLTGLSAKTLPITVTSGTATFKVDLRIRCQAGIKDEIVGIGAGIAAGIYLNVIELVSVIEESATCGMQSAESMGCNVGGYASADVSVGFQTCGIVPTRSTTVLAMPATTICITSVSTSTATTTTTTADSITSVSTSALTTTTADTTLSTATTTSSADASTVTSTAATTSTTATTATAFVNATITTATTATELSQSTSTVFSTSTFTITSCMATVVNCPGSLQTTITVSKTYTNTYTATETTTTTAPPTIATVTSITDVTVMVPCSAVNTFTPPPAAATTDVVSSATYASAAPPAAVYTSAPPAVVYTSAPPAVVYTSAAVVYTSAPPAVVYTSTPPAVVYTSTPPAVVDTAPPAAAYTPPAATYAAGTGTVGTHTASNGTLATKTPPSATGVTVVTAGAGINKLSGALAAAVAGIFAALVLV